MQFLNIIVAASILATFVGAAPLPQDDAVPSEAYSGIPSGVTPSGFPDIKPSGFSPSGAIPSSAMPSGNFRDHHGHHGDRSSGVTPSGAAPCTSGFQAAEFTGSVFPSGVFASGSFGPEPTGGHHGHHEHHEHHEHHYSGMVPSGSLDTAAAQRTETFSGIFPGHGGQGGVRFSSTVSVSATPTPSANYV